MESITEKHNWALLRNRWILGILAPVDTSTSQHFMYVLVNIMEEKVDILDKAKSATFFAKISQEPSLGYYYSSPLKPLELDCHNL
ncbi:hypothetical protein STEG23_027818 [Scotinomys teguina]